MKTLLLTLLLAPFVYAEVVVQEGSLIVSNGVMRETTAAIIQPGAQLIVSPEATFIAPRIITMSNSTLRSSGTLQADIHNQGEIIADAGSGNTLSITGTVTNMGLLRVENSTALSIPVFIQNDGILDLIFSPSGLPHNLSGPGTTVTENTLPPIFLSNGADTLNIPSFAGHEYQVQYTDNLGAEPVLWTELGLPFNVPAARTEEIPLPNSTAGIRIYRYRME